VTRVRKEPSYDTTLEPPNEFARAMIISEITLIRARAGCRLPTVSCAPSATLNSTEGLTEHGRVQHTAGAEVMCITMG
jgi:hypothetical protein